MTLLLINELSRYDKENKQIKKERKDFITFSRKQLVSSYLLTFKAQKRCQSF